MFYLAAVFLIIAIVVGILGFGGIAGTTAGTAGTLFVVGLVLFFSVPDPGPQTARLEQRKLNQPIPRGAARFWYAPSQRKIYKGNGNFYQQASAALSQYPQRVSPISLNNRLSH
jgi:uncharacterized membrane protein YtjA (UPF0391 family)